MARNGNTRKEELLAAARDRLTSDHENETADGSGPEIRYRGRVVRQTSTNGTPGSPRRQFRPSPSRAGNDDVQAALQKIKDLYREGLISRAEAEKKRSEVLYRL